MQAPNWTDFLQCSICTSKFDQSDVLPISLSCSHTLCMRCLGKLKTRTCPYDKMAIRPDVQSLPLNAALLQLLGYQVSPTHLVDNQVVMKLDAVEQEHYGRAVTAIMEMAMFLQPLAEHGLTAAITYFTKPMLKKLVTVVNCQILEADGKIRAVRAARSIADRTVTELLVMHQSQQQISSLLWTAVRNRGCQFLGPVMQEEALKLILRVLESGNSLSRKTIVQFVVQRLLSDFPQASKTSVGHVVQLLYRASCFNVEKRDDDSSLMQLKEEFRSYECLRREHDGQIIRMAMEAGLRISPEQWSSLLYSDHKHKSDMQSIIDKLISQGAASSGLSELIVAIGRSQDPYQLSEKIIPHLETVLKVSPTADKSSENVEWDHFAVVMEALLATLHGFSTYMQIQNGRFKTGMCPYMSKPGGCPKGERCTYAHTEEERDRFRNMVKPSKLSKPRSGEQYSRGSGVGGGRSGRSLDHGPVKAHTDTHASLGNLKMGPLAASAAPEQHYSDLIRYSDELQRLRMSDRRPTSLTAPVLTTPHQDWHSQIPRVLDHTYHTTENGLTSYLSATDHVFHKHARQPLVSMSETLPPGPPYAVTQTLSNIESLPPGPHYAVTQPLSKIESLPPGPSYATLSKIELLRLQHEAVKQSIEPTAYTAHPSGYVEGVNQPMEPSTYSAHPSGYVEGVNQSVELPTYTTHPSLYVEALQYSQKEWVPVAMATEGHNSLSSSYSQPSVEPFSLTSEEFMQPNSVEQQLVGGVKGLEISEAPSTLSSTTSSSVYTGNTTQTDASAQSSVSTVSANVTTTTTSSLGSTDSSVGVASSGTAILTSSQNEMQAEIEMLREQLRMKDQTIHQQNVQLHFGNTGAVGVSGRGVVHPSVVSAGRTHYPSSQQQQQQQLYSNGIVLGEEQSSQPPPTAYPAPSHPFTAQYSTNKQAAAAIAALVNPQGTRYYSTPAAAAAAATPTYPAHQWSGQGGVPPYPRTSVSVHQATPGPPSAAFLATTLPQVVLPSSARQTQPLLEHSDDGMLAAYIQMMEQSKAAAVGGGVSAPTYQATPTYTPPTPQAHYYYPH